MKWTKSKGYSKSKVDWSGKVLLDTRNKSDGEVDEALEIFDNWRAIHNYPMHIFKKRLANVSKNIDETAIAAQRLKRLPSILIKLARKYNGKKPTMKLSQMQDIAGCRVVMKNVKLVRKLYNEKYLKGDLKHKFVKVNDYILEPKKDGYRSIHIIYRYKSDKKGKKDYNGLLVEIQIRSKLQHLWATAIEIVDFFTRQSMKFDEGKPEWVEFFRLISSAFALMEGTPLIENTPTNKKVIYSLIKQKEKELHAIKLFTSWARAVKAFEDKSREEPNLKLFLLDLDIPRNKLTISGYVDGEEEKAIEDYAIVEKKNSGRKEYDSVLVWVDEAKDLRKAYPNYFADADEFVAILKKILSKA